MKTIFYLEKAEEKLFYAISKNTANGQYYETYNTQDGEDKTVKISHLTIKIKISSKVSSGFKIMEDRDIPESFKVEIEYSDFMKALKAT